MATAEEFKADLRKLALERRDALSAKARQSAAEAVASCEFPVEIKPGVVVSGYSPLQSEINPVPLLRKLADKGAKLALPVVVGRGKPLIMRAYAFGQTLRKGVWGIREPAADAPEVYRDILVVPPAP